MSLGQREAGRCRWRLELMSLPGGAQELLRVARANKFMERRIGPRSILLREPLRSQMAERGW